STIANGLILPICDPFATTCASDLTVRADAAGTQVVIDVMGYFLQVNKDNFRVRGYSQHAGRALAPIAVGCGSALSAVLEVRQPGVIVARGRVNLELSHASGTPSRVDWGVSMSPASCAFPAGASAWSQLPAALPTGTYSEWGDASLWYFAESAGTYTFYVNGARSQGRIVTYLVPALATKSFEMMLARTPWKLRRRSQ
ncbi:MAG: hypothetical protein H6Q10_761, partial [Acidobacteria bacterium]|nr:hypothetical protein [Acidobacteriota bacterium]